MTTFENIINWFGSYEGARGDLERCAQLVDGFWVFFDGFSVSDRAVREFYS